MDWASSVEAMNKVRVEKNMIKIECDSESALCQGEILKLFGEIHTLRSQL
jgi:hypothetical protein